MLHLEVDRASHAGDVKILRPGFAASPPADTTGARPSPNRSRQPRGHPDRHLNLFDHRDDVDLTPCRASQAEATPALPTPLSLT